MIENNPIDIWIRWLIPISIMLFFHLLNWNLTIFVGFACWSPMESNQNNFERYCCIIIYWSGLRVRQHLHGLAMGQFFNIANQILWISLGFYHARDFFMALEIINLLMETIMYVDVLKMHMYPNGAFVLVCRNIQELIWKRKFEKKFGKIR